MVELRSLFVRTVLGGLGSFASKRGHIRTTNPVCQVRDTLRARERLFVLDQATPESVLEASVRDDKGPHGYLAHKKTPTPLEPPRTLGNAHGRVLGVGGGGGYA